ncbi:rod shape-determining protein MreB [Catalinimonas alkaloidigena]|uniref:Rod shape-determining protein MreB n=1 Tax=Catalinimonas alkaloidigena TaxID=1075417 RepID=A0A1G9TJM7_9BACT|nr:rod shape-determining protein [Catalinimonas alkaloidigena]SDM47832.1 rod shape-determining protein MreB [Catalinimonas alkaloidigena]
MPGNASIAFDLGCHSTVVANQEGLQLKEPSLVALSPQWPVRVGGAAFEMQKLPRRHYRVTKPFCQGAVTDSTLASHMLSAFVEKLYPGVLPAQEFAWVLGNLPYETTIQEQEARRQVLCKLGGQRTALVYEPLAAALSFRPALPPESCALLMDLGGESAKITLLSFPEIVAHRTIPVAGDRLTQALQEYVHAAYELDISWEAAEQLKLHLGAATEALTIAPQAYTLTGHHMRHGTPVQRTIRYQELLSPLEAPLRLLEQALQEMLAQGPAGMTEKIARQGIQLTGGSALLRGLRLRLATTLGVPVSIPTFPLFSVAQGLYYLLQHPTHYPALLR